MSTVPYPHDDSSGQTYAPGARLVIAFSCSDPMRLRNPWSPRSLDLTGVNDVLIGRADRFEAVRSRLQTGRVIFLSIPDQHLSNNHLRLVRTPGRDGAWQLVDEGSMNGTWVDGQRVTRVPRLADNAVIEVGSTILLFRAPDATAPPASGEARDLSIVGTPEPGLSTLQPKLADTIATLRRVARSDMPILITGETGVGKEVFARAIHRLTGRAGAFVPVHCSAIPQDLLASELFGVEKGAFTGATSGRPGLIRSAHQGTLFLDEIAELSEASQVVLLRVLQDRKVTPVGRSVPVEVDLRVLSATHQDLEARIACGAFRQDLMARLCGFNATLPPLRERREDIGLLVSQLLPAFVDEEASAIQFTREAGGLLFRHHWPNNVRELEHALHAALLLSPDGTIRSAHLRSLVPRDEPVQPGPAQPGPAQPEPAITESRVRTLYRRHRGNKSAIARALGTSRTQVNRLLERHGIEDE